MTSTAINQVSLFRNEVASIKFHKHKRERFVSLLNNLSPEATKLLTFCCWHCLFNFRFQSIDESKYYTIPATEGGNPDFQEFLEVLKFYNRRKVTSGREKTLIQFLSLCSKDQQDFYLSLFSKAFIKDLPLVDIQLELDLNEIDAGEIYGTIQRLGTSFANLQFPVLISSISSTDFPMCLYAKSAHGIHSLSFQHELGNFLKVDPLLPADTKFIINPKLAVVGFCGAENNGRNIFHPIDFYGSLQEFGLYRKGKASLDFAERVKELRAFQADNFLTQVTTQYVGFANSEQQVLPELVKAMSGSGFSRAVITDCETARTGKAFTVNVSTTVGIIESFHSSDSIATGFSCWFNGRLFPVAFDFSGKNNALLHSIDPCKGKLLEFLYLKVGLERIAVGTRILWDQKPWRPKRMRVLGIRVEKCALCGSTGHPNARRSVCKSCEANLYATFDKFGPDVWMQPTKIMKEKRRASCWEARLLNTVGYVQEGCLLVAREDGCWMFKSQ